MPIDTVPSRVQRGAVGSEGVGERKSKDGRRGGRRIEYIWL